MTAAIDQFADHPLAPDSARFALAAPTDTKPSTDVPSQVRPFGLRGVIEGDKPKHVMFGVQYDPVLQQLVSADGATPAVAGPTASTTSSVDGEDPPSSEDWINDFHSDQPHPA